MKPYLVRNTLPYRIERRRAGRRILGWLLALVPWCVLVALWLFAQQVP